MKIIFLYSFVLLSTSIFAQSKSKHVFEIEDTENPLTRTDKMKISYEGIINYFEQIEIEQGLSHPVGFIAKFIEITDSTVIFSMSYFHKKSDLKNYKPFYHYSEVNFKPLLFTRSDSISEEYEVFMNDLSQDKFTQEHYDKIKFPGPGVSISVDCYFEGVAVYKSGELTLKIYADNKTPFEYKPQRDDYLKSLKKHFEYYDKYYENGVPKNQW